MSFASILIDKNTAPGARIAELIANVPTPLISWGVNGLARGTIAPEYDKGRIVVNSPGDYRVEYFMSFESDDGSSILITQILRNGVATHIGSDKGVNDAASEDVVAAADHLALDAGDYISLSLETTVSARITIQEAQLIVTKV
jgi:hypothetical protein